MWRAALLGILVMVAAIAVHADEITFDSCNTSYTGYWKWVRTCGGWTGGCSQVGVFGPSRVLLLDWRCNFVNYSEGTEVSRGKYWTGSRDIGRHTVAEVIVFDSIPKPNSPYEIIELLAGDTLVLSDSFVDGRQSFYARVFWQY